MMKLRNKTFSSAEELIFNMISIDNSLIQSEIQVKVNENLGIKLPKQTISRKLGKIELTRKHLSNSDCVQHF